MTGASLTISIPAEWAKEHNIKAGDKVVAIANGILQVTPNPDTKKKVDNEKV